MKHPLSKCKKNHWENATYVSQPIVLLVKDESAQRAGRNYNNKAWGFWVLEADNEEEAVLQTLKNELYVIVINLMLPYISGLELCRRLKLRKETKSIPIIMLTARSEELGLPNFLDMCAFDYVIKPYSVAELITRLKAQFRRARFSAFGEQQVYNDIRLCAETHKVYCAENKLKSGPTEFRLFRVVMNEPGRVWTREQLLDRV